MRIEEDILKTVEGSRAEILKLLCDLTAIPAENPPGRFYEESVEYIAKLLKQWNIEHRIVRVPHGRYPRYSIAGQIGNGGSDLHFHGHYDVVPAASPDQFVPRIENGRVYGRGTSDMKGGIVVILLALRVLKEYRTKLSGNISFSFVPDEETGGRRGTQHLIQSEIFPLPKLGMLMPEPTSGFIWNANKGALSYSVTIRGKSAHVGLAHQGINSFERMLSVAASLKELSEEIGKRKTLLPVSPPEANQSVMLLGGISGSGNSFNVVPERSFFTVDRRINPEEKLEDAKRELIQIFETHRKNGIDLNAEVMQEADPSFVSRETPLAKLLQQAIQDISGQAPSFQLCPGVCEIRYFISRGIPAYAYGPGLLEVSHGPDEYVNVNDVLNCTKVYALIASRALSALSSG
jgi:acetylornithine deacetylase/succinyl-diaminopimelate desuccinylase family protein